MLKWDEKLLKEKINSDSHRRFIKKLKDDAAILEKKIKIAEGGESNFTKYCRYGIPFLSNLNGFYMDASV